MAGVAKQALNNLEAQKGEVETVHTQLAICLSKNPRTESQGDMIMTETKNAVVKHINEMTDNIKLDILPLCAEPVNEFIASPEACQQFGEELTSLEKCYATGKGVEVAELSEKATAVLHITNNKGKVCAAPVEHLTCELVSDSSGQKVDCLVKKIERNRYEISYEATSQGGHQLHIKVEGEHIKGSPFPVTVIKKLGTPLKTISGVQYPWGVAVNQRGEIIVGERGAYCVSIFSATGEKVLSFGSQGSGHGQFKSICGVALDDDGNIFVVDSRDYCIQKFTPDGQFITAVGREGSKHLEFDRPRGIAIHPLNKKLYITDYYNYRLQILNPDLTFSCSFGSRDSGNGEFDGPSDVACDSSGNVYVTDSSNNHIQVFTAEGEFIRKFGEYGKGHGELHSLTLWYQY